MIFQANNYPALPEDTLRSATMLYGRGNIYLRLGDHLDEMLHGLNLDNMKPCEVENPSLVTVVHCAMLTVFQYVEELPNRSMVEALRKRSDLKYALHLPMNSPTLDPDALCLFRKQLLIDNAGLKTFQSLVERLIEFGFLQPDEGCHLDAEALLVTVCSLNRFDEIIESMYQVLEALAINDPEWLRRIAIPYWYDRYNRRRGLPHISFTDEKWIDRALQIGADIRYLLDEIDKLDNPSFAALREIKEIRHQWDEQFIAYTNVTNHQQAYEWRFSRCASCLMAAGWTQ